MSLGRNYEFHVETNSQYLDWADSPKYQEKAHDMGTVSKTKKSLPAFHWPDGPLSPCLRVELYLCMIILYQA